jgi:choline dehydrogenase-like flavoprotein
MIHDTDGPDRRAFEGRVFDVCVIGSGPAGISFARALAAHGIGRLQVSDWLAGETPRVPDPDLDENERLMSCWHHMGTTRMADDPRRGLVDHHCRVHGVANLHVAGSSVFATGAYANPTYTIVQLALRLADRLHKVDRA